MADFTFGQLVDAAETSELAQGAKDSVTVAAGKYIATIVSTNSSRSSSGKAKIGAKFKIDSEGPAQGGGVWAGQYLSPDSPASLEIWFRTFETLGVPRDHWRQFGSDVDAACADVATRIKGVRAQIVVEIDGEYGPKVKYINPIPAGASTASVNAPVGPAAGAASPAAARPQTPF